MMVKNLLLAGGALLGSVSAASASGFQVYLPGQKSIGMGCTGVGLALDQSSLFLNPGALAMVRENGVQLGANATFARLAFRAASSGEQRQLDNSTVTPFNLYASFGPSEGKWRAGIGVYTPYGSQLKYQEGWEGRYGLTEITLQSIYVQPTVSYAITDNLSVGVGLTILAYGAVNLQKDISFPTSNGHITLDGKTKPGFGVNAGVFFKPSEKLSLGISYRSKIDAKVEDGKLTVDGAIPDAFRSRFAATKFDASLPLVASINFGLGVMPTEKLTLAFDVNFTQWSAYRNLQFDFKDDSGNPAFIGLSTSSISKRDYEDALAFRLGGQYKVNDKFTARLGGAYDVTPVKDGYATPETPDNDRIIGTAGFTYQISDKLGLDGSFMFQHIMERTQTEQDLLTNGTQDRIAGTYKTNIAIPGIGLNYKF